MDKSLFLLESKVHAIGTNTHAYKSKTCFS